MGADLRGRMHGGKPGDRRAGSGKSFTMLFFAARVIRESEMQNPTLVVLTDHNDLDDQLFGQFQRCHDIVGQMPVQPEVEREETLGGLDSSPRRSPRPRRRGRRRLRTLAASVPLRLVSRLVSRLDLGGNSFSLRTEVPSS